MNNPDPSIIANAVLADREPDEVLSLAKLVAKAQRRVRHSDATSL